MKPTAKTLTNRQKNAVKWQKNLISRQKRSVTEQKHRGKRRYNERLGRFAEWFVIVYMTLKGYRLLRHRYKCTAGEIDLIFKQGKQIVFCEVKLRRDASNLLYSVTQSQKNRIVKAAGFWMAQNKAVQLNARFDFIGLTLWQKPTHIKAAF
ncbi:MAG: YraN family protein [Rhizobiales bacterium]|nr:YraN family protein [Hyphomicrobiales bacterium]NRB15270.1 YraN family protein [Hyphomicrobiales bacterium]